MGMRVEFMLGAKDGFDSIITNAMPEFRDWYVKL